MSVESMAIALHHSRATGTAKLVLIGIANHDGDGGAWPSVDTLAKYAGVHRRNVQRAIETLIGLKEIYVVRQGGGTHSMADTHRPNLYRFTLRCPHTCDHTSQHRDTRGSAQPMFDGDPEPLEVIHRGGGSATPPVAVAPPKPPLNHITQVIKPTTVRARECDHVFAESGWCIRYPCTERQQVDS
jgi:hypothetical protein